MSGCPREACGHSADDHSGIFSTVCGVDGCLCGESDVMDERARSAIKGGGYAMAPDEAVRRGLVRMRDHTIPCDDCDDGNGPTGRADHGEEEEDCYWCCGYKELGWLAWWHEDESACDLRDEYCASRDPDADDLPVCHVWLEPEDVWACLPCYLRAHARNCGCDAFVVDADLPGLDRGPVGVES